MCSVDAEMNRIGIQSMEPRAGLPGYVTLMSALLIDYNFSSFSYLVKCVAAFLAHVGNCTHGHENLFFYEMMYGLWL